MTDSWTADVPISMPRPPVSQVMVPMSGFGHTEYGLAHDLTEVDYMTHKIPLSAPDVDPGQVVVDDAGIDGEGDFL